MPEHNIDLTWSRGNETVTQRVTLSADSETNLDVAVPIDEDTLANIAVDVSALKVLFLLCDVAVQIETNAVDATGGNTITLAAGVPLVWFTGCGFANPLTLDVTKFYLTAEAEGTLQVRVLQDATP